MIMLCQMRFNFYKLDRNVVIGCYDSSQSYESPYHLHTSFDGLIATQNIRSHDGAVLGKMHTEEFERTSDS